MLKKRSRSLERKKKSNDYPDEMETLADLADILAKQDKLADVDEVETAYREALEIRKTRLGNKHPDVAKAHLAPGETWWG